MADDFTELVHAQWRPLVRTAVFLGCALPDAEDVVQTALMKAYRSWPRVSEWNGETSCCGCWRICHVSSRRCWS